MFFIRQVMARTLELSLIGGDFYIIIEEVNCQMVRLNLDKG